jgi:hypothetical protein
MKIMHVLFATIALLTTSVAAACPLQECMPQGASFSPMLPEEIRLDMKKPDNVRIGAGALMMWMQSARLAAEVRALRYAALTGKPVDLSAVKMYPSDRTITDALSSDLLQAEVTGQTPQLDRVANRVFDLHAAAVMKDAEKILALRQAGLIDY